VLYVYAESALSPCLFSAVLVGLLSPFLPSPEIQQTRNATTARSYATEASSGKQPIGEISAVIGAIVDVKVSEAAQNPGQSSISLATALRLATWVLNFAKEARRDAYTDCYVL
jgi:hypothetical protein